MYVAMVYIYNLPNTGDLEFAFVLSWFEPFSLRVSIVLQDPGREIFIANKR